MCLLFVYFYLHVLYHAHDTVIFLRKFDVKNTTDETSGGVNKVSKLKDFHQTRKVHLQSKVGSKYTKCSLNCKY